jgi:hypothetical protein
MPKQFLLNPDGSIPPNTNLEVLQAEGIPLVVPTTPPYAAGMVAVEQEPVKDANGVWHQVWTLEPAPLAPEPVATDTIEDPLLTLTDAQKMALIALLSKA